jgi:hypothetical protein
MCSNCNDQFFEDNTCSDSIISDNSKLYDLYSNIVDTPEIHYINSFRDTVLLLENGCNLRILRNSFNLDIIKYKGIVRLETSSVSEMSSVIFCNLTTENKNGQHLKSGGMIFINAFDSLNNELTLSQSMQIEIPQIIKDNKMKLFEGGHNEAGQIIWTQSKAPDQILDWYTVPLDYDVLDSFFKRIDTTGRLEQIKRSYISTNEFMYSFRARTNSGIRKNSSALLYLNGINRNLSLADSLVIEDNLQAYKTKTKQNLYLSDLNSDWANFIVKPLIELEKQKLKQPVYINLYGVDLSLSNAYDLLISKGQTGNLASKAILTYQRGQMIKESKISLERSYSTFQVLNLGWINVDMLYDNPKSENVDITIKVEDYNSVGYAETFMILEEEGVILKGYESDRNGILSFARKEKKYSKLPVGYRIKLVTVAYKNGKVWFDISTSVVSKKQQLKVKLEESTIDNFKKVIKRECSTRLF